MEMQSTPQNLTHRTMKILTPQQEREKRRKKHTKIVTNKCQLAHEIKLGVK